MVPPFLVPSHLGKIFILEMFRHIYKTKCWEGIPDKEKSQLKHWSKQGHVKLSSLVNKSKLTRKIAKRMIFSLDLLDSNLSSIQHDFHTSIKHLETYLHFATSGKLSDNYTKAGSQIKKKLTLLLGLFYNIPFMSSKQLKLNSSRPTVKYYREIYSLIQLSDVELQNKLNPLFAKKLLKKTLKLKEEINFKLERSKLRIKKLTILFKISP